MSVMRRMLLVVVLVSPLPAAAQEVCSCSAQTFSWGGCSADGRCDPGQWHDCTPSPDDGYAIGPGCQVLLDGSDLLLDPSTPRKFRVREGGTLSMRGPAELRLAPGGLVSEPGSRVELAGCFRTLHPTPDGVDCTPALGDGSLFPIGRVIPCRDGQCVDDADTVRLDWAGSSVAIDSLLERVDPARDAICFWQQSTQGALGADSGYCYHVTGVGRGAGRRWLEFDVRQVWSTRSDQAGYPLARRVVQQATLAHDAPAGSRTLEFLPGPLVDGRAGPVGRFVRCEGEQTGALIASAKDDPSGDVLVLADARGTRFDHPAGATCHVDWGWAEGDVAFVLAPLQVTAASPAPDQTPLRLEGATTLEGIVIDGLGGQKGIQYGTPVEIRNGPLVLEHVWVVDPLATDTASVLLDELPCETTVRHLVVTGGPADPAIDKNYALAWFNGIGCHYTVEHLYSRFMGDDNFVLESSGAAPIGAIDLRWVQAGPSSQPGDSGQFMDFGTPNPTAVGVHDGLCTACTSDDRFGGLIAPSAGPGLVEDVLWVGVRNGGIVSSPEVGDFTFRRFGVIGADPDVSLAGAAGPLTGTVSDRFYVRDVVDPRTSSNRLCSAASTDVHPRSLSHGIFSNVALGATPCSVSHASLSDLYFVDVSRTDPGAVLRVESWASEVALSRLTMVFTRPANGVTYGVSSPFAAAAPGLGIDGLLLTGLRGPSALQAMSLGSAANAAAATWGAPTCFYGNVADDSSAELAAFGTPPVRGVAPAFVDPAAGRYDLAPGSALAAVGCGARTAGFPDADWAHRKAKLAPMFIGQPPPLCGLGFEVAPLLVLVALRARRVLNPGSGGASPRGSGCPSDGRAAAGTPRAPTARRD